jgi:hypothetical protein
MEYQFTNPDLGPDPFSPEGQALVKSSLWMRAGFVGASVVALGIITLFTGEARPINALATILGGVALAVLAWRRSWVLLDRVDPIEPTPPQGAGATPARTYAVNYNGA